MLIPSRAVLLRFITTSLSRRVNANSQLIECLKLLRDKLIKKGEC